MDYSFIKLDKEKLSENPAISQINYADCIQLATDETYLQVTDNTDGIAFDGDFSVFVDETYDITSKVNIYEFDNQIAFELKNIGKDFGFKPVRLKFVKTTGSDVWYSNELLITDEFIEETTRFDYRNEGENFTKSIRLRCFYDRLSNETEIKDYYQITSGNTISARALFKEATHYKFISLDPFCFRRINKLLINDVIYIDSYRMTNKTSIKGTERVGYSNLYDTSEFTAYINFNDKYIVSEQALVMPDFDPIDFNSTDFKTT